MLTSLFNGKPRIEQWFAKPIYVHDNFHSKDFQKLHDWLQEFFAVNGELKRTPELSVNSSHQVYNFNTEPAFQQIIEETKSEVLSFARTMGYNISEHHLPLLNMWANLSRNGDYLFPHNHAGAFISGAYYIECESDLDVIKFYNNTNGMITPASEPNKYSYEDVVYNCVPKRLLLFKSDLMHGCPALKGDRKIVLSFNFGLI